LNVSPKHKETRKGGRGELYLVFVFLFPHLKARFLSDERSAQNSANHYYTRQSAWRAGVVDHSFFLHEQAGAKHVSASTLLKILFRSRKSAFLFLSFFSHFVASIYGQL
jgi:hypothetical protein